MPYNGDELPALDLQRDAVKSPDLIFAGTGYGGLYSV